MTPFRILTVCTGNICRSPQAQQLLDAEFSVQFGDVRGVTLPQVRSAGTHAAIGLDMPEDASALSVEYGGNPTGHVARQLQVEDIESADLILAMTKEHRKRIATLVPSASPRLFTLLEYARILEGCATQANAGSVSAPGPSDFSGWLALAGTRRGYFAVAQSDDVIDPFRKSRKIYRKSIEQIAPAVRSIVTAQRG